MNDRKRPLLSGLRDELGSVAGDVAESLKLRLELAQLELADDYRSGKRLAIVLLIALVLLLTSLPLFVVSLADVLDGVGRISHAGWLLIFAALLILTAAFGAFVAWRR
ncbi:MAG: phage holin family protein, partial [Patescibacteria group bacterium]|nr:phage holin family protein [Patescibacteria group bacterium]